MIVHGRCSSAFSWCTNNDPMQEVTSFGVQFTGGLVQWAVEKHAVIATDGLFPFFLVKKGTWLSALNGSEV